ncbi:hypothetical protein SAMN05428989_0561 [Pseudoxanthomonas sp. GM95]|uniref:Pr6Pr family membrane protein n=1 Tax=Pseudoxanthomonas sp. GM95 TaxID=1881043 RepID=UPI0008C95F7A|nr:Pr6Pr family membrane protein [Pseudoxanthomonas sp. GM95]SEK66238.1 hypothetical protein SAMN05428989_0561 [Pseudoxanthomonas sp. GM95]
MPIETSGKDSTLARIGAGGVALLSALAVVLQYALILIAPENGGALAATVRFLSYFTILSNLGVIAVCVAAARGRGAWWQSARAQGAVALAIGVTGLVYVTVLAGLWQPQGLQWWVDNALHRVVPVLYLAWWWLGAVHGRLGWRDALWWLLFPLGYVAWVFARGQVVHEYPYPFLDLALHGVAGVIGNALVVTLVFVVLAALLVGADRLLGRRH